MQPQESAAGFVSGHPYTFVHFSRQWVSHNSFHVLHLVQFPGGDQTADTQSDMFYGGFGTGQAGKIHL